ncbi:hypothetical protein B0T18DRAFT_432620 [Schizothecium vesticola]|uniref:Uncharacterized protein n=1 Tax=Schizothecium vesticola TaxID=314040 RepID=A0AA40ELG0_9PEZI|nr:hypothetical protein B0T18DRAFT_432620 [Schizothecium vesticola]
MADRGHSLTPPGRGNCQPTPAGCAPFINTSPSVQSLGIRPPTNNPNNHSPPTREGINNPAPANASQFANVDSRPEKKRKFTDELELRAAVVANRKRLAKKFDQIDTRSNHEINDKSFPLREIPTDELEHRLHTNLPHYPSYLYTIDDQHPDVNFYSVQNAQTGRVIGKVDITDKEAMLAMVDTLMGLGKRHGAHVGTFTFDIRSIEVDTSTEAYKRIQARNAPLFVGQDTELGLLGQRPQQPRQHQQHEQPKKQQQKQQSHHHHQQHQRQQPQQPQQHELQHQKQQQPQQPQQHEQQQQKQQKYHRHQPQRPQKSQEPQQPQQHEQPQGPQQQEKQHQQHQQHQWHQKSAEPSAGHDEICGHCGVKGHMLYVCCMPMSPTGSCRGGSIAGCPFCNTMAHNIDACSALDKYLDDLPKLEQTKFLAKMLCFNRRNRPAIRSEKWFFLDHWVPWTDSFSLQILTAPLVDALTPKGTMLPNSIVSYTKNAADRLPKDPYWTDTMVYQMIEYHKAGWYDDLRYISPLVGLDDTTGDGSDKPNDLNRDALEAMILMWAKKAGLVVQRTFGGRVKEQVALPDELPIATQQVITMGSFSVTVPKEVLLNPGGWVMDDPTASIPSCENGQMRTQRFMVYKTTPAFDDLVKNSGLMVWQ